MQETTTKISEAGLTKLWVVWKDGHKKSFRSFDSSGRYSVADPRAYGIRGLKKMVAKMGDTIERAILYDTTTGLPIEQLYQGQWVPAQA